MSRAETIAETHPYMQHLLRHRRMWETKPAVRALYRRWYAMIVRQLGPKSPMVELGCGCGNFKEYCPEVIATDSFHTPWCDQVVDACELPFEDASVGNLVLFDVLHHIPAPSVFFEQARRVLVPGGRVVMVEPAVTYLSSIVYRLFHHEPVDMRADLLADMPAPGGDAPDYANSATATVLFRKRLDEFTRRFPNLRVVHRQWFSGLSYPMIGGFRKFCLLPAALVGPVSGMEDFLIHRLKLRFLAMRMLVVLEKNE